jgi:hypothetical protein
LAFLAPKEKPKAEGAEPVSQDDADDAKVLATVDRLVALGKEPNKRRVEAHTGISKMRTDNSLERLVLREGEGRLTETEGARRARIFTRPSPVTVPEDHSSSPALEDS